MRCLIVDDESLALQLMEDNVKKVPFLHLVGKCRNAFEVIELLAVEPIDLIFLDIQMPGLTGIQLLNSLTNSKPMVVFVTAYEQYALQGYNLDVLDYLVKPAPFERFLKACNKAKMLFDLKNQPKISEIVLDDSIDFFFVNADYGHVRIDMKEITHVEGMKDYIKIYVTNQQKPVITRMSMKAIEEKLKNPDFLRVHKSFIVAIKKIEAIRNKRIMIEQHVIPISDNYYRDEIQKLLGN